jgi:hypothetical protein
MSRSTSPDVTVRIPEPTYYVVIFPSKRSDGD